MSNTKSSGGHVNEDIRRKKIREKIMRALADKSDRDVDADLEAEMEELLANADTDTDRKPSSWFD